MGSYNDILDNRSKEDVEKELLDVVRECKELHDLADAITKRSARQNDLQAQGIRFIELMRGYLSQEEFDTCKKDFDAQEKILAEEEKDNG